MSNKVYGIKVENEGIYAFDYECEYLFTERESAERYKLMLHALGHFDAHNAPVKILVYKNARIGKKEHQKTVKRKVKLCCNLDHDILHSKMVSAEEVGILIEEGYITISKEMPIFYK